VAIFFFARTTLAQIEQPRIKTQGEAVYPEAARGLERDVVILVTIDTDGKVAKAEIPEPIGDALDDVALDAAKKYEFFPATKDGKPIKARIKLKLSLHGPPKIEEDAGAPPPQEDAGAPPPVDSGSPVVVDAGVPKIDDVEDVHVKGKKTSDSPNEGMTVHIIPRMCSFVVTPPAKAPTEPRALPNALAAIDNARSHDAGRSASPSRTSGSTIRSSAWTAW